MTVAADISQQDGTVRGRLIRAADAEIIARGSNAVQMEAIAKRAGVSRATAFRQLGTISEVRVHVALLRARRHAAAVDALMATRTGVFAKFEAALVYTARELPRDATIAALFPRHSARAQDPRGHQVAMDVMGPVLKEGRRNGEVRTDLQIGELVDYLVEQTLLAAEGLDRSAYAVRRRIRHFVVPSLAARDGSGGEYLSRTREVEQALTAAIEALGELDRHLPPNRVLRQLS